MSVWAAPTQRQSVATNAAAGALYGVVDCALGRAVVLTEEQHAVAIAVAQRVTEHLDAYDRERREETGRCPCCGAPDDGSG